MHMPAEYKVQLDVYQGPLDLLLYLIKREEVDIHDIPIARIADQYCRYVEMLQQMDINLAGEFLVMAATLMEIKSACLLPRPPAIDGEEAEDLGDPRVELVRQLLEYKAFKDAAADLEAGLREAAERFGRGVGELPAGIAVDPTELDMGDLQVWDLLAAFQQVMSQVLAGPARHEVIYDDTPVDLHAEDILDMVRTRGELTFEQVFEGRTRRTEVIGLFLALLELIKLQRIVITQSGDFHSIRIGPGAKVDQPLLAGEIEPEPAPAPPPPAPAPSAEAPSAEAPPAPTAEAPPPAWAEAEGEE
jgi:segregation and condensation protein A